MHFKHPELLYALLLLVVPIIVHLFQLRKFKKVEFTNVAFLKAVKQQTRKSQALKKWLTLLTRLLLLACVILAFAQPFIPNSKSYNKTQETVVYLDNSHSMQAQGSNGSLLDQAIKDLINSVPETETISLFTNNNTYKSTTLKAIKNELIALPYTNSQLDYNSVYLKGKQLFSNSKNSIKNLVVISDFQQKNSDVLHFENDSLTKLHLVQLQANTINNVSIDSLYLQNQNTDNYELTATLKTTGNKPENISVALYNNDALYSKTSVNFSETNKAQFSLLKTGSFNGKLQIEDAALTYDNSFYFNLNKKPKIKVLCINGSNTTLNYLNKIFTNDEFEFKSFTKNKLNYNLIPEQNLIVLNEITNLSNALVNALKAFKTNGGSVTIIPAEKSDITNYNYLFQSLNITERFSEVYKKEKRITTIQYNHPLLATSFYDKVTNFQYPKSKVSFGFQSKLNSVLNYEDGLPFLVGNQRVFVFASALHANTSNFKNSPLIVPVFYNMGLQSLRLSQLYYTIGKPNAIAVNTILGQDDIVTLHQDEKSVIPPQKTYSKHVVFNTENYPDKAGFVTVKNKAQTLTTLSFNYNRNESKLNYYNVSKTPNIKATNSIAQSIESIKSSTNINALWKWFVIFAIVFLIAEMLILKYLK